jgi:hypothetical protein
MMQHSEEFVERLQSFDESGIMRGVWRTTLDVSNLPGKVCRPFATTFKNRHRNFCKINVLLMFL